MLGQRFSWALVALLVVAGCKSETSTRPASTTSSATQAAPPPPVSSAVARVQVQISMRTSDHLAALRDVFQDKGQASALRAFFDPGVTGDAPAAALFDHATKLSKEGWRVQRFEVRTIRVDPTGASATADVFEWLVRNGQGQCRTYTVPWMIRENGAYRGDAYDVREAKCPASG
jgi:hypothetical protein